ARCVWAFAGAALACLLVVLLLARELRLVGFDPAFARSLGRPAHALDLLLLGLFAVVVGLGVPALGALLSAALVLLPAAGARCWAARLGALLLLASAFGLLLGVAGVAAGPTVVAAATALFLASLLLAPGRGLLARRLAERAFRRRLDQNRLLAALYDL